MRSSGDQSCLIKVIKAELAHLNGVVCSQVKTFREEQRKEIGFR